MKRLKEYSGLIVLLCVFAFLIYYLNSKTFDISKFNVDNEYKTISELTSKTYEGRLAGTKGNELALSYAENYFKELGLKPAGDNGTYRQSLRSMVPMHLTRPYLKILDKNGKLAKEYVIGRDYREILDGYGGNGQVDTELLYLKNWIRDYDRSKLAGKVIVVDTMIGDDDIEYAIDNGVKGILCPVINTLAKLPIDTRTKMGKTIMIHYLKQEVYPEVMRYATKGYRVSMKLDEQFSLVETPNLLAKIEGKNKNAGCVVFSAHMDGYGQEYGGDIYYPGATDGGSGTAVVMELARIFNLQKHKPEKTIIFTLWNNEIYGKKGKGHYMDNPIYPLENTTIVYINNVGTKYGVDYIMDYNGQASEVLRDKLAQFSGHVLQKNDPAFISEFAKGGATAVGIRDNLIWLDGMGYVTESAVVGSPQDTMENMSKQRLADVNNMLLSYIKKEMSGDIFGGLFNSGEKTVFFILIGALLLVYILSTLNRIMPERRIGRISIEDIYYSTPFELINKLVRWVYQAGIVLILLVFVTNIPPNLNLFKLNGVIHTNFSWNQVIANTVGYFRRLWNVGFGMTSNNMEVWEYIRYAFEKSFLLLLVVLVFALIFGVAKGIFDAFRDDDKNSLRTVGTIMVFSLPDVFVVLVLQILLIYLYSNNIVTIPREYMEQKLFVEAFLCLIILPSIYITRIASVAVHEEKKKGYIKAAKAKGLSNFGIIRKHLLISIVIKVTEALPSLLSLMISNLIIVEYLSSYKGIVTNMMIAFRDGEVNAYTGLAISLCALYVAFVVIFRIAGKLLNPLKRREL